MSRPADPVPAGVEPRWEPSFEGSVVIEVGGDIGALIVYTEPEMLGAEIEIVAAGHDRPTTHAAVRERRLSGGPAYAALFGGVWAGQYTLRWGGVARDVAVSGARVTELRW